MELKISLHLDPYHRGWRPWAITGGRPDGTHKYIVMGVWRLELYLAMWRLK